MQFEGVPRTAVNETSVQRNAMKIVRSQEEALSRATATLSNELYEIERDLKSTLATIDGYATQAEVPEYLMQCVVNAKLKVADITMARAVLFDISWQGTKEAPKP